MITLTIKKPDGNIYATEYFDNQITCDNWLAQEKTRPYWLPGFTVSQTDDSAAVAAQKAAIDAQVAADSAARAPAIAFLKNIKRSDLVDMNACATAIMHIVKFLRADQ